MSTDVRHKQFSMMKQMIQEQIETYKPKRIWNWGYHFGDLEYVLPEFEQQSWSNEVFQTSRQAQREALAVFDKKVYRMQEKIVNALVREYDRKCLKNIVYYRKEEENYYHQNNIEIMKRFVKVVEESEHIFGKLLDLPDGFWELEIGPGKGFDIALHCDELRELKASDIIETMKPLDYYKTYINVQSEEERYRYSLEEAMTEFRENILWGMSHYLERYLKPLMDEIDKEYSEIFVQEVDKKLQVLKSEMKKSFAKGMAEEGEDETERLLKKHLRRWLEELKDFEWQEVEIFHRPNQSYDHSFCYRSREAAEDEAAERAEIFYRDCVHYLQNQFPKILGKDLQKQLDKYLTRFRNELQDIYDRYGKDHPNHRIEIESDDVFIFRFNLNGYEKIDSFVQSAVRDYLIDYIKDRIDMRDYFDADLVRYEINKSSSYREGLFGGHIIDVYNHLIYFDDCEEGFEKAREVIINKLFESDFLCTLKKDIMDSLKSEVEHKLILNDM